MTDEPVSPEILIEFPQETGFRQLANFANLDEVQAESRKAMDVAMSAIREMAYKVSSTIQQIRLDARPDEVEVEFSLKVDVEAGAVVPIIAKTTAGGQFSVRFVWRLEKPGQVG